VGEATLTARAEGFVARRLERVAITSEGDASTRDAVRRIVANRHSGVGPDGALTIPLAPGHYLLSTSATPDTGP
jgi:hypothetical protein